MKPHKSPLPSQNKSICGDSCVLWPVWNRGISQLANIKANNLYLRGKSKLPIIGNKGQRSGINKIKYQT